MSSNRRVSVNFADATLAKTLRDRLESATGQPVEVVGDLLAAIHTLETLVTSTTRCSPVECAGLTEAGARVIVLASVPSAFQAEQYANAGAAAYLPMALDLAPLLEAIARVETSAA